MRAAAAERGPVDFADLLLTPPVREFSMMDLKSYDRIVDAGYQYARTAIAEWQERLAAAKADKR